jgi:hypothetical protein
LNSDIDGSYHKTVKTEIERRANINRWNNARLKALDDQNGFIYLSYQNEQGQVSTGWLDKKGLIIVGN